MDNCISQLGKFVQEQYARLARADPRASRFPCPGVRLPFQDDEACGFIKGLESGLFSIEPERTHKDHFEMTYRSELCAVNGHFFGIADAATGRRNFSREGVTQWAAASDLVLEYGWPTDSVRVESSDSWALDLLAFDRARTDPQKVALLAGEAKSRKAELDELVLEMMACRGRRPEAHKSWPKRRTSHRKCEGLLRLAGSLGSVFFWGVAPDHRLGYRVTFTDARSFSLEEVAVGPYRPEL